MEEESIFMSDSIPRSYIRLALPVVMSMVVTLVYNLADTFFVARTGCTELVAGVSLGAPLFTFLMAVGNVLGQGGSVLISRLLGQDDRQSIGYVSSFCFYATFIIGLVLAGLMLLFRVPLLYLLGANDETFGYASDYFIPLAIGAPFLMLSFIHSNILRSEGLSKESMIGTVTGALVNIVLDPILISGVGMGASGAAIATIIGYICSDLIYLYFVLRRSRVLSVSVRKARVGSNTLAQILGIGIPAALANLMQSFTSVLMNQYLLPYGNDKIAAMGIVLKVSMIALLILTGFAFGGQPLYGYYFGLGDRGRLSRLFRFTLSFILAVAVMLTLLIILSAPLLMMAFMSDDAIIREGSLMLRLQVVTMPFVGAILLLTIVFQAAGKIIGSFILSISRQGLIFLIAIIVLSRVAGYGGIIAAQAAADIITMLIAVLLFRSQIWRRLKG